MRNEKFTRMSDNIKHTNTLPTMFQLTSTGMKIKLLGFVVVLWAIIPNIVSANTDAEQSLETQLYTLQAHVEYFKRTLNIEDQAPLSSAQMRSIVTNGTAYLQNAQRKTGSFSYEYVPYKDIYNRDDNIVRQAGALYELGEVVRRDKNRTLELSDTIEGAIAYFENLSREDEFLRVTFRCIVENKNSSRCKLGATSLALIGILSYVEAYPEKEEEYKDLIKAYANYIMGAKNIDAGFRDVHNIGDNGQPSKESPFSNGEALLALVRYFEYKQGLLSSGSSIKHVVNNTFEYLQGQEFDPALYLWAMAALKDMQRLWPNEEYVSYAKEFTALRIDRTTRHKGTQKNFCAYSEGIASAYSVLDESATHAERSALRNEIDFWNKRNSRLQIDSADMYRISNIEDELVLTVLPDLDKANGGFLTSNDELTQRIDFTQHCISSYIQTLVDIDGVSL
ncbi:MAG: hypothetical protein ACI9VM_000748 [Candidatus Azotimanducaceae bacterium]|jgi:hypothetical protein